MTKRKILLRRNLARHLVCLGETNKAHIHSEIGFFLNRWEEADVAAAVMLARKPRPLESARQYLRLRPLRAPQ